ncbi:general secretion pathway protein GspB [Solimonas soli]|uniref:general secretion pathway protein GspB n=1 Tax=Solimonas soli TaxID=413479 RepID=UPI00048757FC|nr:general secretion pathway protein GspB [Solimonas soli]
MSYILEALRRAERERQMSKLPTVESLAQAPLPGGSRVPLRIWLLGGATIVVAAAALVAALWPRAPAPQAPAPAPTVQAAAAQPAAPVVAPTRAPPRLAPTGIEDDGALQSLDDVAGNGDAGEQNAANPDLADSRPPTPARDTMVRPNPPPAGASSERAPPATLATGDSPPTIAVPDGATVLREMPDAYRAQFPVRTLDVHVYDPDPARRWIMVAGKRYAEGQTLDSGPRVVEITDSGVIFDFQNARVLLPVR